MGLKSNQMVVGYTSNIPATVARVGASWGLVIIVAQSVYSYVRFDDYFSPLVDCIAPSSTMNIVQ